MLAKNLQYTWKRQETKLKIEYDLPYMLVQGTSVRTGVESAQQTATICEFHFPHCVWMYFYYVIILEQNILQHSRNKYISYTNLLPDSVKTERWTKFGSDGRIPTGTREQSKNKQKFTSKISKYLNIFFIRKWKLNTLQRIDYLQSEKSISFPSSFYSQFLMHLNQGIKKFCFIFAGLFLLLFVCLSSAIHVQ